MRKKSNDKGERHAPCVALVNLNPAPLAGGRFISDRPGAAFVVDLTDKQRVRAINKACRALAGHARDAADVLASGCQFPSGHPKSPANEREWLQRGIARVRDVLSLLEAGDAYLATLPEPDTGPTMGEVLNWPEVIEAAQRAALARGYKPPSEARASHLRIVSSDRAPA